MVTTVYIILAEAVIFILAAGIRECVMDSREKRLWEKKEQLLERIIESRHLDYPVLETVRTVPLFSAGTEECIIAVSYVDFFKGADQTVKDIFTGWHYRQYIQYAGCTGQEERMLYGVLQGAEALLGRILLWSEFGNNRTVRRWYSDLDPFTDTDSGLVYFRFEDACINRYAKLPVCQYKHMIDAALDKFSNLPQTGISAW